MQASKTNVDGQHTVILKNLPNSLTEDELRELLRFKGFTVKQVRL